MDPPLVSFSVMLTSTTYRGSSARAVSPSNVLAHDQHQVSKPVRAQRHRQVGGHRLDASATGNPLIRDTTMWLDCELWSEHEAGDHLIVIGRVLDMSPEEWHRAEPLVFFKGAYRHLREPGNLAS